MAKAKKISRKITTTDKLDIEGFLNLESLNEGKVLVEIEDNGEVNITHFLQAFDGKYIKLSLTEKTDQEVDLNSAEE